MFNHWGGWLEEYRSTRQFRIWSWKKLVPYSSIISWTGRVLFSIFWANSIDLSFLPSSRPSCHPFSSAFLGYLFLAIYGFREQWNSYVKFYITVPLLLKPPIRDFLMQLNKLLNISITHFSHVSSIFCEKWQKKWYIFVKISRFLNILLNNNG